MYLFTSSSCSWSFPSMYLSSYNFAYINTRYNFTHRNTERTMWVSMEVDILTNNIKQMYRIWIWYNSILIRGKRKWSGYGLNRFRFSYSVFWYHFLICPKIRIQCKRKGTVFFYQRLTSYMHYPLSSTPFSAPSSPDFKIPCWSTAIPRWIYEPLSSAFQAKLLNYQ